MLALTSTSTAPYARLTDHVPCPRPLREPAEAFGALLEGRIGGKVVLHVD